jgi:uncharacterized protein (DUF362 family)
MAQEEQARSSNIDRRRFNLLLATGLVSSTLPQRGAQAKTADRAAAARPLAYAGQDSTPVAVAGIPRGDGEEATARAVRNATHAATDFSWLSRGDTVLIKTVCNSGNPYPATTDPVALRAMIALLREKGAGRVIVADMSGVQAVRFGPDSLRGSTRELMSQSGMLRAAEDAGAEVQAFEEQGWDAFFEDPLTAVGAWRSGVMLPTLLHEVDHVVLMPRCARHLLAGSTLGLKAAVGWWRHDSRLEYHSGAKSFSEKTAEANTARTLVAKQRLVVTSASKVLTTFGPDQGYVHQPETGLVVASTSLVAHDMVSLAWLIESRRVMPADERDGFLKDPNESSFAANFANRIVCSFLGGVDEFFKAERLTPYTLERVWDDKVLRRAFDFSGGVPRVELVEADRGSLPRPIRERLSAEVELPA